MESAAVAPSSSHHLLRAAYSLAANTAITAALGLGFWLVAARVYSHTEVGRDSVLISVMIELSTLCQLNLGNGFVRFLPDLSAPRRRRAVLAVYAFTASLALVVGLAFVLVAPRASNEFSFLGDDLLLGAAFVASLVLWGIFTLQDAALTALRRATWVPIENAVFGIGKLAALPLLAAAGASNGIFAAWTAPMAIILIPMSVLLFRRAIPAHRAPHGRESSVTEFGPSRLARFLALDYVGTVFTQATLTLLPLLVLAILGAQDSAYFAIPFMIAMAFDTLAYSTCTSLVVEGTLARQRTRSLARLIVRRVLMPLLLAGALLIAAAPLILLPFGAAYGENGADVLRLLLCGSLLRPALALFSALSRIEGHGPRLVAVEVALFVFTIGLAIPLAFSSGIVGVAAAWLAANALICAVVVPYLFRVLRSPRTHPPK